MLELKGRLFLTLQVSEKLRKVNAVFKNVFLKKQNTSPLYSPNHTVTLLSSRTASESAFTCHTHAESRRQTPVDATPRCIL